MSPALPLAGEVRGENLIIAYPSIGLPRPPPHTWSDVPVDFPPQTRSYPRPVQTHTTLGDATVPGIVFMRGGAVSILPILTCGEDTHVLLCRQARVPAGFAAFPEIPAGRRAHSGCPLRPAARCAWGGYWACLNDGRGVPPAGMSSMHEPGSKPCHPSLHLPDS
jgi:hypothetical protein